MHCDSKRFSTKIRMFCSVRASFLSLKISSPNSPLLSQFPSELRLVWSEFTRELGKSSLNSLKS